MSDEEKKAIEKLKERVKIDRSLRNKVESDFDKFCEDECIAIETVLNLIDKQQKEIEEAIEYIENAKKELYGCGNYYLLDLLKILKGVKYE